MKVANSHNKIHQTTLSAQPIWILVANAEEAFIYLYSGPKTALSLHHTLSHSLPKTHQLVSDQRGKNKNQQMPGGETYAEPTDPKTHEKEIFAKEVASYLFDHHQDYKSLVIVAAPAILGMLRGEMHKEVKNCIAAQVDKNLTHFNAHSLPEHLDHVLKFDIPNPGFDELHQKKRAMR